MRLGGEVTSDQRLTTIRAVFSRSKDSYKFESEKPKLDFGLGKIGIQQSNHLYLIHNTHLLIEISQILLAEEREVIDNGNRFEVLSFI
jgi:hypothetical protein